MTNDQKDIITMVVRYKWHNFFSTLITCWGLKKDMAFLKSHMSIGWGHIRIVTEPPADEPARKFVQLYIAGATKIVAKYDQRKRLLKQLEEIAIDCSARDWNGYDAEPVSKLAIEKAKELIEVFPIGFPEPELAADNDGEIGFDFYFAKYYNLTFSTGTDNRIPFATCAGEGNSWCGVAEFNGKELPKEIIDGIEKAKAVPK
jgi:hypothetical protein